MNKASPENCTSEIVVSGIGISGTFRDGRFIGRDRVGLASIDVSARRAETPTKAGTVNHCRGLELIEGILRYRDGETYKGPFKNCNPHGHGEYLSNPRNQHTNVERFVGEFINGEMRQGEMTFRDGRKYAGGFVNFSPSGKGVMKLNDGEFTGNFKSGFPVDGNYIFNDGRNYIGALENDFKLGPRGELKFPNGDRYLGEFRNGLFHGEGTYYWANGERHVGQWANGKADGYGKKMKDAEVVEQSGLWKAGVLVRSDQAEAESIAKAERSWESYKSRQKTILEQVMNYSTTGLEDGIREWYWVQEQGKNHCVLNIGGISSSDPTRRIDIKSLNASGFRIATYPNGRRILGDEQQKFQAHASTVVERLQRAWGLAFKECPSENKRAF